MYFCLDERNRRIDIGRPRESEAQVVTIVIHDAYYIEPVLVMSILYCIICNVKAFIMTVLKILLYPVFSFTSAWKTKNEWFYIFSYVRGYLLQKIETQIEKAQIIIGLFYSLAWLSFLYLFVF